jgi:hypothetical protein
MSVDIQKQIDELKLPEVGDLRTFTLVSGMEIVGTIAAINDGSYTLVEAFAVQLQPVANERGEQTGAQVGLAPLSPFAMTQSDSWGLTLDLYNFTMLLSLPAPDVLVEAYDKHLNPSGLITPPEKKIQVAR